MIISLLGKTSCTSHLIAYHISRVVIGALEPDVFIAECQGMRLLNEAGIEVKLMQGMEKECLEMNNHILKSEDLNNNKGNSNTKTKM